MVRLGSRSNSPSNQNGGGLGNLVTFWGMVGATMAALKMKDRWDEYRSVPSEPGANPLAPPVYRDDDCDTESAIGLDTSMNVPQRTKRKRNCCFCCGINCSLFCKAFGIVVLIFVVWNGIKLVKWAVTPSLTGLEDMPEYSKSLGCLNAAHFYQDNRDGITYTIDAGDDSDLDVLINGDSVGTLVFAPSPSPGAESVTVRATVRSSDARALSDVAVHTSTTKGSGAFTLDTPSMAQSAGACVRYDVTVFLPPLLRTLRVTAHAVAQVKFDYPSTNAALRTLSVALRSRARENLLLPSAALVADNTVLTQRGGFLVGALAVANSSRVDTQAGDAVARLTLVTADFGDGSDAQTVAHLSTATGAGRADFVYENAAARPVRSEHIGKGLGSSELRLTYDRARFNGRVEIDARSYSMRGVQSYSMAGVQSYSTRGVQSDPSRPGRDGERWVGDKDGGDFLKVSTRGWVGLYF